MDCCFAYLKVVCAANAHLDVLQLQMTLQAAANGLRIFTWMPASVKGIHWKKPTLLLLSSFLNPTPPPPVSIHRQAVSGTQKKKYLERSKESAWIAAGGPK